MELKFKGIDDWNRPIFKDNKGNYYGSTTQLFSWGATGDEVIKKLNQHELCYFGRKFGCEPYGTEIDTNNLILKP